MDEVQQVLNKAAGLVESLGWRQGLKSRDTDRVCAVESITLAIDIIDEDRHHELGPPALKTLAQRLGCDVDKYRGYVDWLVTWNDERGSKDQLLAALEGRAA